MLCLFRLNCSDFFFLDTSVFPSSSQPLVGAPLMAASQRVIKDGNRGIPFLLGECSFQSINYKTTDSKICYDCGWGNFTVACLPEEVCTQWKWKKSLTYSSLNLFLQCGQRGSLRSRQTSRWCGARGCSCPVLSSTTQALCSGPRMAWLWESEKTSGVRHHSPSSGCLCSVQHVTKTGWFKADSDTSGSEQLIGKT